METFAALSIVFGILCSIVVAVDISVGGHRQKMLMMNVVWPITALYSGPLGLYFYIKCGRQSPRHHPRHSRAVAVGISASHCGAGCTIADFVGPFLFLLIPFAVFGRNMYGEWVTDFALAFGFGIAFQYFAIRPMMKSGMGALKKSLQADALSLSAWQVGMYLWMAFASFVIFHHDLAKSNPVFWFMMQIGMIWGFVFSYPVNWWLIRRGLKRAM